jgi:hypothetical protein
MGVSSSLIGLSPRAASSSTTKPPPTDARADLVAGGVERGEAHPVGVEGQALAEEGERRVREGDGVAAEQREPAGAAHGGDDGRGALHVHAVGGLAQQAEDDGLVAPVAAAGGAERPEELGAHRGRAIEEAGGGEIEREGSRRAHGADRVRAGGADADLEEVEDADGHAGASLIAASRAAAARLCSPP